MNSDDRTGKICYIKKRGKTCTLNPSDDIIILQTYYYHTISALIIRFVYFYTTTMESV